MADDSINQFNDENNNFHNQVICHFTESFVELMKEADATG